MITARWWLLLIIASALVPAVGAAQGTTATARSGVYFESYRFGSGLAFDRISEFTIPISVTQRLGDRLALDIGTAFASASVRLAGGGSIDHSGLIDTDLRATLGVIPGKLVFNLVGTIPTGATAVPDTTIPLFGATATDVLGFTTPSFGTGGGISAGFASAFKMSSDWAIGTGMSYRHGASYTPVTGGGTLTPGGEVRVRFGLEGPFGGGGGGGGATSIVVSIPFGRSHLALYGWEMRRLRARNFDAPATLAVPRGNLLALGARLERALTPRATLVPTLEFRHELTGPTARMELLGFLVRTGTDLRYQISSSATGVIQASLAFGTLQDQGTKVSILGRRLGALIEWSR